MNRLEKKKMIGLIGIVLVIASVIGIIPTAINGVVLGVIGFSALLVIGFVMVWDGLYAVHGL